MVLPKTGRILNLIFAISIILATVGCVHWEVKRPPQRPVGIKTTSSILFSGNVNRIAYSSFDNTVFLADTEANTIYLYRDNQQLNTIGGLGFGADNFNRLSDIKVSPTGRLLALDSFRKEIKQFDTNGKWLENHHLSFLQEPVLFDVSRDGTLFIYDRTADEIIMIDDRLTEVLYRFGKFYFGEPVSLVTTINNLIVYDSKADKTFIFDLHGQLLNELSGFWQRDRYDNSYKLSASVLTVAGTEDLTLILSHQKVSYLMLKESFVHQISGNSAVISEIVYRTNDDRALRQEAD